MGLKRNKNRAYKLNSLVILFLLIAFAVVFAWSSSRFTTDFDLTSNSRHSLSETSINILGQISDPILITAYARDDPVLRDAIRRYVGKYQLVKSDIELKFINPETSPGLVRGLGIRNSVELVFEYQGRTEHVRAADENIIINTLVRLWRGEQKWIAFVTGHGERNLLGQANHDLGDLGNHLNNRGYNVQPINLAEIITIPDNTSVLVMAGTVVPMLPGEIQILLDFIQRGGNFFWLLDPGDNAIPAEITDYLKIKIANGTVIDISGQLLGIDDPTITVLTGSLYGSHPVLEEFDYTTLYPMAAVLLPGDSDIWTTTPLLTTGSHTWLETGPLGGEIEFDKSADLQGPLTIGLTLVRDMEITIENTTDSKEQRIVVVGDGDFLSNTYLANSGNLDLGLRLLDWLSHDEELITIPSKSATDTQLTISSVIISAIGIFFLMVMPLVFISTGFYFWWKRKRS